MIDLMTKLLRLIPLIVILLLVACSDPAFQQGEFSADCSWVYDDTGSIVMTCYPTLKTPLATPNTPTATTTPQIPTATRTPTGVPTAVPTKTATSVPSNQNLFVNPSFEGGATIYAWAGGLQLPEVAVVNGWSPLFCDFPYRSTACPALFQGDKNPEGLLMGRPEMRNTDISSRVHSGAGAQYWFCFWRACDAGVYQTVNTAVGETCTVSAYVMSWSRFYWDNKLSNADNFLSQFLNDDSYSNSLWRIGVNLNGGTSAYGSSVLNSPWYSLPRSITSINGEPIAVLDHYDKFALLTYTFTAQSERTTIFIRNLRLFPANFNDNSIDDASIVCIDQG